jgi:hypothetical protein
MALTDQPQNGVFIGPGLYTNLSLEEWEAGTNCRKEITRPDGGTLTIFLRERCFFTFMNDSCPVACLEGTYQSSDRVCRLCSTGPCPTGLYRSPCSNNADAMCTEACTNGIPENAEYSSGGFPFDNNNCSWVCQNGFYRTGQDTCLPCDDEFSMKPRNASYTAPGGILDLAMCPWACDANFTASGMLCIAFEDDERCREETCPYPEVVPRSCSAPVLFRGRSAKLQSGITENRQTHFSPECRGTYTLANSPEDAGFLLYRTPTPADTLTPVSTFAPADSAVGRRLRCDETLQSLLRVGVSVLRERGA